MTDQRQCGYGTGRPSTQLGDVQAPLGDVFSYSDALASGMSKERLYALRKAGKLDQLGRGLYRRKTNDNDDEAADPNLLEIRYRVPLATICLLSALARHRLIEATPDRIHVAVPRGVRHPPSPPLARWHSFGRDTFQVGRQQLQLANGISIGIYSPERSIIDVFRTPGQAT